MAKKQFQDKPIQLRRAPLTERAVERLVGFTLRNESMHRKAKQMLQVEDFADHQRGLAAVYAIGLDFYEEHQELPDYVDIVEEIERRLDEAPESLSEDELELLDRAVKLQYQLPDEYFEQPKVQKVFRKMLRMFLEDRTTDKIREDFSSQSTVDVFGYLQGLQEKTRRIAMSAEEGVEDLFPRGWSKQRQLVELRDTTIPFLNVMLDGGDGCGEVNGLLAPFGTCKTTFAVQMSTGRAKRRRQEWVRAGRQTPLGISYLFIYEGNIAQMRVRSLMCAGQIHASKLKDTANLNRRGVYDDYERVLFRDMFEADVRVPCERDRVKATSNMLNTNFRVVCMSGHDEKHPGRGSGYVEEIANIIETDQQQQAERWDTEVFVECVTVDYVGAAVERAAMANNWSESERRIRTERFPYQMGQMVANRFYCPCWCMHQLSGQANSLAPGKVPKGTDAKDTKSFKENLDFLFIVGSKNHQNLCVWVVDKARRFETALPPEIIYVDGTLGRVRAVSGEFVLDRQSQEIVAASELRGMIADHSHTEDEDEYEGMTQAAELVSNQMREIASGRRRRRQ